MRALSWIVCLLALADVPSIPRQPIASGTAYHYRAGMFRTVAANRGMSLRGDVLGYASVPDCARIGDLVYARVGDQQGWFQILDCSDPADVAYQQDVLDLVIEVNYDVALAGGWAWDYETQKGVGRTDAEIYAYKPGADSYRAR